MSDSVVSSNPSPVVKIRRIYPLEVGSRRVTPMDVKRLVLRIAEATSDDRWADKLDLTLLGRNETLSYPFDTVHEGLERYEVSSVQGNLEWVTQDGRFSCHIRLSGDANSPCFDVSGPPDVVDSACSVIDDSVSQWTRSYHSLAHHPVNRTIGLCLVMAAAAASGGLIGLALADESISAPRTTLICTLFYAQAVTVTLFGPANAWLPMFWFYRENGYVDKRRRWIKTATLGAVVPIVMSIAANLMTPSSHDDGELPAAASRQAVDPAATESSKDETTSDDSGK